MSRVELLRWDGPAGYEVAFSTRVGGVSEGAFASLNIGLLTDDERRRVEENRRRLYESAGADPERTVWPRQVHGARVLRAVEQGREADGLWTDERGVALTVVTADCLPVALARTGGAHPAVALVHVGWRGLAAGIVAEARAALGAYPVAGVIGPGIGSCCYEVGEDVATPIEQVYGPGLYRNGRLDLPTATERALRAAGVARVDRLDACTACHPERFFSHRRDAGVTGRQGAIARVA
jgi:hypothetical protein